MLTESHLDLNLRDPLGPISGVQLTLRSNRGTEDTINGPDAPTGSDGHTEAFVNTRNQGNSSTIVSTTPLVVTTKKGIVTWLPAKWQSSFYLTCYITALETDYSAKVIRDADAYTWCSTVPEGKRYRAEFMRDVMRQGSGRAEGGEFLKYSAESKCYYISPCATTASGACAEVGTTVAVDRTYIKVVPFKSSLLIDAPVGPRLANDAGGTQIKGYHIDVYGGVGQAACSTWPNYQLGVELESY